MARQPIITRDWINERLKSWGYSDPENMSENERMDAGLRIMLKSPPRPLKTLKKKTDADKKPTI